MERIKTDQEIDTTCYPCFAEADSSLEQGYFPDLNKLIQSVSRFSRDDYTPAFPINSPPEAYEEGGAEIQTEREREHTRTGKETHRERRLNSDLFSCFQEFREFRELLL